MAESSQSSSNFYRRLTCYCGIQSKLQSSWTEINPGRRFYGCGRYRSDAPENQMNHCDFFQWYDNPPPERFRRVINGLLRKTDALENQIEELQGKNGGLTDEIEEQVAQMFLLHERIDLQSAKLCKLRLLMCALLLLVVAMYFSS